MNKFPQFSLPLLQRRKPPDSAIIGAMLELIPLPAVLLRMGSGEILYANRPALTASGYEPAEVSGQKLDMLFSVVDAQDDILDFPGQIETPLEQSVLFHPKGQPPGLVNLAIQATPLDRAFTLATWTGQNTNPWGDPDSAGSMWQTFLMLVGLAQQNDFDRAVESALNEVRNMLQAQVIGLYLASDNEPVLRRLKFFGEPSLFPEHLPVDELFQLRTPAMWTPRKRGGGSLYQAAGRARLAYLATTPLGQNRAAIGLVVIGGAHPAPDRAVTLLITRILAASLTNLVQAFTLSSEHQNLLLAHERSRNSLKILEEGIEEGLVYLNRNLRILRLNPAAELMLGYTTREVVGQPVDCLLIGSQSLTPALEAAQHGSPSYNLGSVHLYRRNGEQFLCQARTLPTLKDRSVEGIVLLLEDLNEKERIRLQSQQLEQQALLGEVTAIFAHEVRNPINNLSTGLQVLAMKLSPEDPAQAAITRMQEDCDRLEDLMSNVLNYGRATEFEMDTLDIGAFMQRMLDRYHPRLSNLKISYELQIEADCRMIIGNLRALEQVFTNLITNAIQAMEENGGRLMVKIRPAAESEQPQSAGAGKRYLEISIADSGPGIAPENLARIFQPFFTTKQNGTGLGLPICKRIITAHRGALLAESFPGATIFRALLPAADIHPGC